MRKLIIIASALALCTCAKPPGLLDEIRAAGELRVVTRNSPITYYVGPHGPEGPEYDLARGFAEWLGVELRLFEAHRFSDLIGQVESGNVHMAAAGLTITEERASRVDFGPSYQEVSQQLIFRRGRPQPRSPVDLRGRRLEVVAESSYVATLTSARAQVPELAWTENPSADAGELLDKVAGGHADFTVVDSNIFNVFRRFYPELRVGFDMSKSDSLAWAFPRRSDRSLIEEAERYLEHLRESGELAHIMDRYYGHNAIFDYAGTRKFILDVQRLLPRYRRHFEAAAERADVDWRLLAAVGYQESHWNAEATSHRGAMGIMMLIPSTAEMVSVANPYDPAQNILGGAKYFWRMKQRVDRLAPDARERDRKWMALAAYNMGYGHLLDARQITVMNGGNPDRWVDIKDNLPLLMEQKWYTQVRWGYAHSRETLAYVRNIRNYYDILVWLTEGREVEASPPPPRPGAAPITAAELPVPVIGAGQSPDPRAL